MCIAIRYFATGANYTCIADVHGVSKSSVTRAVKALREYFRQHLTEYVEWPKTNLDKQCKSAAFYRKTKKPQCFGLVDGTHIPISCPRGLGKDENQYFCYKGYYSINAMVGSLSYAYCILNFPKKLNKKVFYKTFYNLINFLFFCTFLNVY